MNNTMKKRFASALVIVVLIAVAIGVVAYAVHRRSQGPTGLKPQAQEVSLRLKWLIYSSFAHHFVALDRGYFKAENLDVHIDGGGPGIDPIRLVASGENTFGLASYGQIIMAREKGIPVVAIAEEDVTSGSVIMALEKSNIRTPQDLIGKTVAVIPGSDTGTVYAALMKKLGIDRTKIKEVPGAADIAPLLNGSIDATSVAFITNHPIQARHRGVAVTVIDPHLYGVNVGGNVFFTSEAYLHDHRDVVKRFLKAELRAMIGSQKMPDEDVVDLVMRANPKLDRASELDIWRATKKELLTADTTRVGLMSADTWTATAQAFQDSGLVKTIPPLEAAYTNALVKEVQAEAFGGK